MPSAKSVNDYAKVALEMKKKGLSDKEIADELHLSLDTVGWLLMKKKRKKAAPPAADVRIGWRSVGVFPHRTRLAAGIMADIAMEELGDEMADTVVGIAINGVSLATFVAETLELELAIFKNRPDNKMEGTVSSNFAGLKGKKIMIIDDVIGTGDTMKGAIKTLRAEGAKPILCMVMVNKTGNDFIEKVRLRGLVRALVFD
jgi:orotate phosphoribosyltransferase